MVSSRSEARQVSVPVVQHGIALDDPGITVYGSDGKKIDPKNLPKLTGPAPILVSADGKEVDPFYLGLAKQGTLIVVSPSLAAPDAGPLPMPPMSSVPPKP